MNSQDMSIYWNQRKGQYETNNFYGAQQQQQNPFTITADRRLKYTEEAVEEEENEEASVSIGSWLGTLFLMIIPVINIFALIGMAVSSKNENKKAFARAMILFMLVLLTVALVIMALTCDKIDYASIFDKVVNLGKTIFAKVKGLI